MPTAKTDARPIILVVDDYEDALVLYEEAFKDTDCDVIMARNGAEAVALAANRRPDAIVMDLHMPDMDGWEAIRQIRSAPIEPTPYIVAVTAHRADRARLDAYDAGADDFVTKPVNPRTICSLVTRALATRS